MAQPKPFVPVKLVCGILYADESVYPLTKDRLVDAYGPADFESGIFDFNLTDYYEKEMGPGLKRRFISFATTIAPDELARIKLQTNALEARIREERRSTRRAVNIDPGYLSGSALVMATAKDFSHRVALADGIYAHLELLFTRTDVRFLEWTYPDFRQPGYRQFFLEVRRDFLKDLKERARLKSS